MHGSLIILGYSPYGVRSICFGNEVCLFAGLCTTAFLAYCWMRCEEVVFDGVILIFIIVFICVENSIPYKHRPIHKCNMAQHNKYIHTPCIATIRVLLNESWYKQNMSRKTAICIILHKYNINNV